MTPEQLAYVVETVEQGSFARAARATYCTPQAVSKGVRELERELGVCLFERRGKGVVPTGCALELAQDARAVLCDLARLREHACAYQRLSHASSSGTCSNRSPG